MLSARNLHASTCFIHSFANAERLQEQLVSNNSPIPLHLIILSFSSEYLLLPVNLPGLRIWLFPVPPAPGMLWVLNRYL